MSDDFTDEELMAYADGELDPVRASRLVGLLAMRPDLAERMEMFARTRGVTAESVKAHLDEPVPGRLKASVEDMIRQASRRAPSGAAPVTPLTPRKTASRPSPFGYWIAPIAASLIALISGAVGYWVATNQGEPPGYYQVASTADPELTRALSTLPSGGKSRLTGSGAEIALIASFYRGDQVLCREFQIAHAEIGDHLAVACHTAGKWSVDLAIRTSGGTEDGYRPASSAETLDAFLSALGAGPAIVGQAETDALGKIR